MTQTNTKTLETFYEFANAYLKKEWNMTWDMFPDYVSPWNEGLNEHMTRAMIKVLAVRCCKLLVKKCS